MKVFQLPYFVSSVSRLSNRFARGTLGTRFGTFWRNKHKKNIEKWEREKKTLRKESHCNGIRCLCTNVTAYTRDWESTIVIYGKWWWKSYKKAQTTTKLEEKCSTNKLLSNYWLLFEALVLKINRVTTAGCASIFDMHFQIMKPILT